MSNSRRPPCPICGGTKDPGMGKKFCDRCATRRRQEKAVQVERFWSLVEKGPECWRWLGRYSSDGYTRYRSTSGHRVAYQITHGLIPKGVQIDHLCNNPWCVRPEHLEAVTPSENMRRAADRRTHCRRGHELTPENTKPSDHPRADGTYGRRCITCYRLTYQRGNERAKRKLLAQREAAA